MDLSREPWITEQIVTMTIIPFLETGGTNVALGDITGTSERVQRMLASVMDRFPDAKIAFIAEAFSLHPCLAFRSKRI